MLKIIDFTRLLPGPLATHLLAQMGAEVIKIESPKRMDYVRKNGPQVDGTSVLFHQLNHKKQLKTVDYNTPEGKAEVIELIKDADALIEQFRPGAMESWGLGYEEIKKINSQMVYVSLTGYGQEGAFADEAGHDLNYLAHTGILSLLVDESGKPVVPGFQLADIGGAYMAVMALQNALIQKLMTKKGAYVDVALSDAVMPFLTVPFSLHSSGLDHNAFNPINGKTMVNYAVYECADGKWLSVGALEVKFWNNLCDVVNKPEWKRDNQIALMNQVFPKDEVEALFRTKSRDEWMEIFQGKDVCVAPVLEVAELEGRRDAMNRVSFEAFETPGGTVLKAIALPFQMKR